MPESDSPSTPVLSPRISFAVAVAAGLFSAVWPWLALTKDGPVQAFDLSCAQYWKAHEKLPVALMIYLTDVGGVAALFVLTIVAALWQLAHKNRVLATAWFVVAVGGALLNQGSKVLFDRDRPGPELRADAVHERNKSYPSGHSMGSIVGYGMLGYVVILTWPCRMRRLLTIAVLTALILAIGLSRIYLRAHWFSDVIGGWAMGLCWLCACLGWLESRRGHPSADPPPAGA